MGNVLHYNSIGFKEKTNQGIITLKSKEKDSSFALFH